MNIPQAPQRLLTFFLLVAISVTSVHTASARGAFSKIVVFGDSLNDHGNMVQFTGGVFPAPPTYAYGRQSNGPVWVEYLAKSLKLSDAVVSYAVVGAMTKAAPGVPTGNVWSDTFPGLEGTDVASQVADYLRDAEGSADPAALYILEGGANDFPRVENAGVIVSNLVESLVSLQTKGARHILLVNLPDLGKTPRVILGEQWGLLPPGTGVFVSAACARINQALLAALPASTFPGVTVTIADTYGFIVRTEAAPASQGFVNVTAPFLLFGGAADASAWLWWDDLHPTTRGHEVFADQVLTALIQSYSPGRGSVGKGASNSLNGLVTSLQRSAP